MFKYLLRRRYGITGNYFGNVDPRDLHASSAHRLRLIVIVTARLEPVLLRLWSAKPKTFHTGLSDHRQHATTCAVARDHLTYSFRNFQPSTFNFQASGYNSSFDLELRRQSLSFFLELSNDRYSACPRSENCQAPTTPIPRFTTSTTTKRCSQKSGLSAFADSIVGIQSPRDSLD